MMMLIINAFFLSVQAYFMLQFEQYLTFVILMLIFMEDKDVVLFYTTLHCLKQWCKVPEGAFKMTSLRKGTKGFLNFL